MADRMRTAAIQVEVIHHDTGHWCLTCKLATGFRVWAVVRLDSDCGGPGRMHMQVRYWCSECQGRHVVADETVPL